MTNIIIHGKLGKIYGKNHKFKLKKITELVPAINANAPGFKQKILGDFKSGHHYYFIDPKNPDKEYNKPEDLLNAKPPEEIHIVPAILGAGPGALIFGGLGLYGIGGSLTAAGVTLFGGKFAVGKFLQNIAIGFILSGIEALLFPPPDPKEQQVESKIDTSSYIFSSLRNNANQGFPIPLVYGELRVGSSIISTNVVSQDAG